MKIIHTDKAPAAVGPYSQAIAAGDTLYLSGQIAINPAEGRIVAVREGAVLATSFHPEVTGDLRLHQMFVDMVRAPA